MHALTQEVVRELLMGSNGGAALGAVLEALDKKMGKFDYMKPVTYFVGRRYVRHVKTAALHTTSRSKNLSSGSSKAIGRACNKAGTYFDTVACSYDDSLRMYEQSVAITIKVLGKDHVDVAASYMGMANVYFKQGKYGEALELHEQSVAIKIKVLGKDHVDVLNSQKSIVRLKGLLQGS